MVLPVLWVATAWGMKHLAVYQAGSLYGWPRLYRRALEYSIEINGRGSKSHDAIKSAVANIFRSPSNALATIEGNTGLLRFLASVEDKLMAGNGPSGPAAVVLSMARNTKTYKHVARAREMAARASRKPR